MIKFTPLLSVRRSLIFPIVMSLGVMQASAAPVYLNSSNITVAVGAGTSPGSFNNTFDFGGTISKVIDAPTAASSEIHSQPSHIWFTASAPGGGLELKFDFGLEYDINTLHFWNYNAEGFDVDQIAFSFYNSANSLVGSLGVAPALGDSPAIFAQDIVLAAPLNVQFVTAFLTGSNQQVDFQNIGFTADVSVPVTGTVPDAGSTLGLLALAFGSLVSVGRRFRK